ncbi:hypothetical protein ACJMK2_015763 [Sinanodonta woodiana]|uniref:Chitin-binding type-2 domain-containing protein n=1 Tax=Sinanodonta woodiana TaxID=1069815 RepID=A0ABD3UTJ1_SINWO
MNRSTKIALIYLAVCTVLLYKAYGEEFSYTDVCSQQKSYYETCLLGNYSYRCLKYRSYNYTCNKTSSCTYSLRSCGECSVSCGNGTQSCSYECRNGSLCVLPEKIKTRCCNTHTCPVVNGGWGLWTRWSSDCDCSVTCANRTSMKVRTRFCNNPAPENDGALCVGASTEYQSFPCSSAPCPVDGKWSAWNVWTQYGACTVTCDKGIQVQTRNRTCTNPECGGRQCNGPSVDYQTSECYTQPCSIDGNWGPWNCWTAITSCSVTCETGVRNETRSRTCSYPTPQYGGRQCNGISTEFQTSACYTKPCPIDGNWGAWNGWSSNAPCSVTCGGGNDIQTRNRSCTDPPPQNGGRQCSGTSTESQTVPCCSNECPQDGGWNAWNSWTVQGDCSVTCNEGLQVQTRNRVCTNPIPKYGGKPCNGTSVESQPIKCTGPPCPIDGNWGPWNCWASNATCSATCGSGFKIETRSRICSNPSPQYGGTQCNGASTEYQTRPCNIKPCPIDGNWGDWNGWTSNAQCSVTCGGGNDMQTRNRSCTNPPPQNGGRDCIGTSTGSQTVPCCSQGCPQDGSWSTWTNWNQQGACSITCGDGVQARTRNRVCTYSNPQYGGRPCNGSSVESQPINCTGTPCPVDGNWGAWNSWTSNTCSVTCGTGVRTDTRIRTCSNPAPQYGGRQCNGTSTECQTVLCNNPVCVIDGGWSAWTCWTSVQCNNTCNECNEILTRKRNCTNPVPQNGGRQCNGTSDELKTIPCGRNGTCPIVDGGWSGWCDWITDSDCSATCGGGTKPQRRTRTCTDKSPRNGGKECIGLSAESRIVRCNPDPCPPVDGRWGPWNPWTYSNWNVDCYNGKQTRTRTRLCNRPAPQNCGKPCNGSSEESELNQCNKDTCPLECAMSSETAAICGTPSSASTKIIMSLGNGGSRCNPSNCTCAEITHGYVRHPTDCTKFIQCAWNVPFVESCPIGTYWDQSLKECRRGTC